MLHMHSPHPTETFAISRRELFPLLIVPQLSVLSLSTAALAVAEGNEKEGKTARLGQAMAVVQFTKTIDEVVCI